MCNRYIQVGADVGEDVCHPSTTVSLPRVCVMVVDPASTDCRSTCNMNPGCASDFMQ